MTEQPAKPNRPRELSTTDLTRPMSHQDVQATSGDAPTVVSKSTAPVPPELPDISIEGVLGRGGMGVVYRGVQTYLDRKVAIKVLEVGDQSTGDQFVQRFRREAKLLAQFDHAHIVKCYQAGVTDDERPYLVMELVEGCSLAAWVQREGAMDEELALQVMADLAAALGHAHDAGMIHRDVKPENVLLQTEPAPKDGKPFTVKLADLGLARATSNSAVGGPDSSALTAAGIILGTPTTMAPEQFDDPDSVDYRADIYGLGCVLYYMLAGKQPFGGKTLSELLVAKATKAPPDPQQVSSCCDQTADLVKSCLAYTREGRPQSYQQIEQACREPRRHDGKSTVAPSPGLPVWVIPVVLVVVVAVVWFIIFDQQEDAAIEDRPVPVPQAMVDNTAGAAEPVQLSADSQQLEVVASGASAQVGGADGSAAADTGEFVIDNIVVSDDLQAPAAVDLSRPVALWRPAFAERLADWDLSPSAAWGADMDRENAVSAQAGDSGQTVTARRRLEVPQDWQLDAQVLVLDIPGLGDGATETSLAIINGNQIFTVTIQRLPAGFYRRVSLQQGSEQPRMIEFISVKPAEDGSHTISIVADGQQIRYADTDSQAVPFVANAQWFVELRASSGIAIFDDLSVRKAQIKF